MSLWGAIVLACPGYKPMEVLLFAQPWGHAPGTRPAANVFARGRRHPINQKPRKPDPSRIRCGPSKPTESHATSQPQPARAPEGRPERTRTPSEIAHTSSGPHRLRISASRTTTPPRHQDPTQETRVRPTRGRGQECSHAPASKTGWTWNAHTHM